MKSSAESPRQDSIAAGGCDCPSSGRAAAAKSPPARRHHVASYAACLLLAVMSGCAMCQSPWDYCNAVIGPGGCPNCDFGARCGSAFAPIGHSPATTEMGPTPAGDTNESTDQDESPEQYFETPSDDPLDFTDNADMPGF